MPNAGACAELCRKNGKCAAFTWRPDKGNSCWLKNDWTQTHERTGDAKTWSGVRCTSQETFPATPSRAPDGAYDQSRQEQCLKPGMSAGLGFFPGFSTRQGNPDIISDIIILYNKKCFLILSKVNNGTRNEVKTWTKVLNLHAFLYYIIACRMFAYY